MNKKLIIFTDGGARGNPGPAAIGVVFGEPLNKSYGEQVGSTTNNVAEYRALIFALKKTKQLLGKGKAKEMDIEVRSDSELVVKQQRGEYQIKERSLVPLFIEVWNLRQEFKSVSFVVVRREANREADALVNRALDTLL